MFSLFQYRKIYGSLPTEENNIIESEQLGQGNNNNNLTTPNDNSLIEMLSLNSPKSSSSLSKSLSLSSKASTESSSLSENYLTVIANTMNALLGVSIFAMPWGFMQSGVLGGSILIMIIGLLSLETSRILLSAQRALYDRTGEVKSYPEIAEMALESRYYSTIVQLATLISCIGGCVGYLIFLGETVGQLFAIPLAESIYYVTIPLILLSWVRSFRNLAVFTFISVISIILAVFTIIYDGSGKMMGSIDDVPLFLPMDSTLQFLGPATFLFTIHYCVLSMGSENLHEKVDPILERNNFVHRDMAEIIELGEVVVDIDHGDVPRQPKIASGSAEHSNHSTGSGYRSVVIPSLTRPLIIAYASSAILIALLGAGGFIVYRHAEIVRNHHGDAEPGCRDHVCQNVILNLSPGWLRAFVGLALIISIMMSYIIILIPAREHIELAFLK
jgi:hypothetical protein